MEKQEVNTNTQFEVVDFNPETIVDAIVKWIRYWEYPEVDDGYANFDNKESILCYMFRRTDWLKEDFINAYQELQFWNPGPIKYLYDGHRIILLVDDYCYSLY